jgi:two-component system, NtrC family, nitrogen regulation sensor histidine kinase GlnL
MSANKSNPLGQGQEGLSFASALGVCVACGVIFLDSGKRIAALSAEAGKILGLDPNQILGHSFEGLPEPLPTIVREVLSSDEPPRERQLDLSGPGRQSIAVRIKPVRVRAAGEDSGLILVLTSVIAPERFEREIRQLDRLASIGTLAASMAHEIRNALVAGKTFTDLLLEKHKGDELVEVVRRETARIDALVSRMLKFAGTTGETFSPVHLHEILERSFCLMQAQLASRAIVLDRSFKASPDVVNGNDYALEQAFVNLLVNAVEAIGENGNLSVATERIVADPSPDGALRETAGVPELRVTIKDTGAGIAPANMDHMFEPFFTTKATGTGLGLVITRRIVQEHRGLMTIQSAPGQGTTFQITLPAMPARTE